MTLQEAIAEMKDTSGLVPWDIACDAAVVILNAVASGDMIPKADAERAVAAAYELTVKEVECWLDEDEWPETRRGLTMAILALAPADALAEVQALQAEVARLRALVRRVVNDPVWRTNDNTLWPDLCAAIRPAQGDAG